MDKLCYVVWCWEDTKCDQCHRMKDFIQKLDGANTFQHLYHLLQKKKKQELNDLSSFCHHILHHLLVP